MPDRDLTAPVPTYPHRSAADRDAMRDAEEERIAQLQHTNPDHPVLTHHPDSPPGMD
jgi:hypothetical protein